jgi:hypothetical protein
MADDGGGRISVELFQNLRCIEGSTTTTIELLSSEMAAAKSKVLPLLQEQLLHIQRYKSNCHLEVERIAYIS